MFVRGLSVGFLLGLFFLAGAIHLQKTEAINQCHSFCEENGKTDVDKFLCHITCDDVIEKGQCLVFPVNKE